MLHRIAILTLLLSCSVSKQLFYDAIPELLSTAFYSCLKESQISKVVLTLVSTEYEISSKSVENIYNAKNAGLEVEINYTPCRTRNVEQEYQLLYEKFRGSTLSKIWVSPEGSISKCAWSSYSPEENCKYIAQYIDYFHNKSVQVGVVTWRSAWISLFNGLQSCKEPSTKTELWWYPHSADEMDLKPNFNDYLQIGGWQKPYAKFYSIKGICGKNLFANYYE